MKKHSNRIALQGAELWQTVNKRVQDVKHHQIAKSAWDETDNMSVFQQTSKTLRLFSH